MQYRMCTVYIVADLRCKQDDTDDQPIEYTLKLNAKVRIWIHGNTGRRYVDAYLNRQF